MSAILKLRKIASLLKNTLSAAESLSILYILKLAGYEDEWKQEIEELAKKAPKHFESIFQGKNRIYIPFGRKTILSQQDEEVIDFLHANDFNVPTNDMYIEGYAESKKYPGRLVRIGKIFEDLKKEQETILDDIAGLRNDISYTPKIRNQSLLILFKDYKMYKDEYNFEMTDLRERADRRLGKINIISENFRTSPTRQKKNVKDYQIVISQDPHDVAKMSYERSWKSCRTLKKKDDDSDDFGTYCESTLEDVEQGGLVAYLIEADDVNIEKPIARIAIRKFQDDDGRISAKAERTVYGIQVDGFKDEVQHYLSSNFPTPKAGYQKILGGSQTDTFDMSIRDRDKGFIFVENLQDLNNAIITEMKQIIENPGFTQAIKVALENNIIQQSKINVINDIAKMFDPNFDPILHQKRYQSKLNKSAQYFIGRTIPKIRKVLNTVSAYQWTDKEKAAHKKLVLVDTISNILTETFTASANDRFIQDMERAFQAITNPDHLWALLNFPSANNPPKNADYMIEVLDKQWAKHFPFSIESIEDKFAQILEQAEQEKDFFKDPIQKAADDIKNAFLNPSESLSNYIIGEGRTYPTEALMIMEQMNPLSDSNRYEFYPLFAKFIWSIRQKRPYDTKELYDILISHNFPNEQADVALKEILIIFNNSIHLSAGPSLIAARAFIQSDFINEP